MNALEQLLFKQLSIDEDRRSFPYNDTVGKTTIGIGRNLTDRGLSQDEIDYLFANDLKHAMHIARMAVTDDVFDTLCVSRQAALVNMSFNLGMKLYQFHDTLLAIKQGRYTDAAHGMRNSLWAKQVGDRAVRLAEAMEKGA